MQRLIVFLIIVAIPFRVFALPSQDQWTINVDPKLQSRMEEARNLIKAERFADAIPLLRELTKDAPEKADIFNWLGFAYRNTGDFENSASAYEKALQLEPSHLQALEYQGQLFLALDNHDAAEANLRRIEALCAWPCEEKKALTDAIAAWRAEQGQ